MDRRTTDILLVIIEEYVSTAEPVGSKTLVEKYSMGVSSATVRNEMHRLEQEGYITSLHTSSGRIPTDKGYRFYVDYLTEYIKQREIEENIYKLLRKVEAEDILERVFTKLFAMNPYTTLGVLKRNETKVESFQILTLAKDTFLLVLLLKNGVAAHKLLKEHLGDNVKVRMMAEYINEKISNKTLREVRSTVFELIEKLDKQAKDFFIKILTEIVELFSQHDDREILVRGKENLLSYPDFKDVMEVKGIFDAFNKEFEIGELLLCPTNGAFSVSIGNEIKNESLTGLSIAKHTYNLGSDGRVTFGIAGPVRMDYKRVMSILNDIENILGRILGHDVK